MLLKQESITFPKLVCCEFWRIANSVFNKAGKFAVPPLFSCPEVLSSAYDKAKLCEKLF